MNLDRSVRRALPLIAAVSALTFAELWEHGGGDGLSLAERLQRRRRPDLWGDTVTVVIALGSIGLGILVALAEKIG